MPRDQAENGLQKWLLSHGRLPSGLEWKSRQCPLRKKRNSLDSEAPACLAGDERAKPRKWLCISPSHTCAWFPWSTPPARTPQVSSGGDWEPPRHSPPGGKHQSVLKGYVAQVQWQLYAARARRGGCVCWCLISAPPLQLHRQHCVPWTASQDGVAVKGLNLQSDGDAVNRRWLLLVRMWVANKGINQSAQQKEIKGEWWGWGQLPQ